MKIVIKDNFDGDLFTEVVVAENVSEFYGERIVKLLNDKYWTNTSKNYFALVEDDYELYDGYADYL